MRVGRKQTIGPITVPTAAADDMGFIKYTGGAETILVRARGGNSANNITLTALACYDTSFVYGTDRTTNAGLSIENGGVLKSDGDANSSAFCTIHNSGRLIPCPVICLVAQAATGDVTGVIFEVWPIYRDANSYGTLPA